MSQHSSLPYKSLKVEIFRNCTHVARGHWLEGHFPVYTCCLPLQNWDLGTTHEPLGQMKSTLTPCLARTYHSQAGTATGAILKAPLPALLFFFCSGHPTLSPHVPPLFSFLQTLFSASCHLPVNKFMEVFPDGLHLSHSEAQRVNRLT